MGYSTYSIVILMRELDETIETCKEQEYNSEKGRTAKFSRHLDCWFCYRRRGPDLKLNEGRLLSRSK